MDYLFDYDDIRAKKARLYIRFNSLLTIIFCTLTAMFLTLGVYTALSKYIIGYFIASFAFPCIALVIWLFNDLKNPKPMPGTVSGMLDTDVLGRLQKNSSPQDIMRAVLKTHGGSFFAVRFQIPVHDLDSFCSNRPEDATIVWSKATDIYALLEERNIFISSVLVMAALMLTQEQIKAKLPEFDLSEEDILAGCRWASHIEHIIDLYKAPHLSGGIGRDWAFGYTPVLDKVGTNISAKYSHGRGINVELSARREVINNMVNTLDVKGGANVALIGPLGSGKTAIVETFAEDLIDSTSNMPSSLRYQQIFSLDASALLSVADSFGGIERLLMRIFYEAVSAKNIILFFDAAELFFQDGIGSVNLTNVLLPILESSSTKVILAMEEQRFLQISKANPAIAAAMNQLSVKGLDEVQTMLVIQDQLVLLEHQKKVTFTYQALQAVYRLSNRYLKDLVQPGAAVRLLASSANTSGVVTQYSVQKTIESTIGVKVGSVSDAQEKNTLLNLEDTIHKRMINQSSAVKAVSSALRRARTGVRNENRPIGTFLFLGPTGVGKTELAKSLAASYFRGEEHLVRIDLNEYVLAKDVKKLIADGANNAGSLAAQILKDPFSVVLLDEIEKAHDSVLAALLQVLDEGILRDENNKEVSFRDAIIIATSNAGATRIRSLIDKGEPIETMKDIVVDELIDSGEFKPEFLNRFDEIAIFRPLTKDELMQVLDLILNDTNKNLAVQKIAITVADDAREKLVDAGYDPRLGARPLRRVVQNTVEDIISKKILAGEAKAGDTIHIARADLDID